MFLCPQNFIMEKKTYRGYKMDHGHIIAVNKLAEKDYLESQKIWDFSITKNVFSLFFSILIILTVFIKAGNLYKSKPHAVLLVLEFWSS